MFGIGAGELVLIVIVVLLAVGPEQMPKMLRVVGRGVREVRKATRELQSTVGLNEILSAEEIRDPLGLKKPGAKPVVPKPGAPAPAVAGSTKAANTLSDDDLAQEQPAVGVDLDLAFSRAEAAIVASKAAAAGEGEPGAEA